MVISIARLLVLFYAVLFTAFALFSGTENTDGIKGLFLNLPNILPWLLIWGAVILSWKYVQLSGALFGVLAMVSIFCFHTYRDVIPFLLISFPLIVSSILLLTKSKR